MSSKNQIPKSSTEQGISASLIPASKTETDLNGKFARWYKPFYAWIPVRLTIYTSENTPSSKRLKLEPIEHQSSASIVEEIARGKFALEQDKKDAEKKIVILEAEKKKLEDKNSELDETLKILKAENLKKNAQIVELKEIMTSYRKSETLINYFYNDVKFFWSVLASIMKKSMPVRQII